MSKATNKTARPSIIGDCMRTSAEMLLLDGDTFTSPIKLSKEQRQRIRSANCGQADLLRGGADIADELLAALKELMPKGWGKDDTMDHMPGIKRARLAIAKAEGRSLTQSTPQTEDRTEVVG